MYRTTEWPYLMQSKPEEARKRIDRALKKHAGNMTHAALELGVDRKTLYRYRAQLEAR